MLLQMLCSFDAKLSIRLTAVLVGVLGRVAELMPADALAGVQAVRMRNSALGTSACPCCGKLEHVRSTRPRTLAVMRGDTIS